MSERQAVTRCRIPALGLAAVLLAAPSFATTAPAAQAAQAAQAERQLMRHGTLEALVAGEDWCAPDVAIVVRTDDVFQFGGDRLELQRLVGQLRALVPFECPAMQRLLITGEVGGRIAFSGIADEARGGVLEVQPQPDPAIAATAAPPTTAAAAPTTAAAGLLAPDPAAPAQNRNRSLVRETQRLLNALGFDAGPVDGAFGGRTRGAIEAFEQSRGLARRGDVTAPLLDALDRELAGTVASPVQSASGAPAAQPSADIAATDRSDPAATGSSDPASSAAALTPPAAQQADLVRRFGLRTALDRPIVPHPHSSRDVLSDDASLALARFLTLLELGLGRPGDAGPGGFTDDHLCLASNFVAAAGQAELLDDRVGRRGQRAWRGTGTQNEFEVARARAAFATTYLPELVQQAPALPLGVVHVSRLMFGNYDAARGGFPLDGMADLARGGGFPLPKPTCGAGLALLPLATPLPDFWPIDPAAAEALIARQPASPPSLGRNRVMYVAATLTLSPAPEADLQTAQQRRQRSGVPVRVALESLALYEDPALERHLHSFDLRAASDPVLLSGLPDALPVESSPLLDEAVLALRLLRDHGDQLGSDAWAGMVRHQLARDRDYYDRVVTRDTGNMAQRITRTEFDPAYLPFFPRGTRLDNPALLPAQQSSLFRDWSRARAEALPDTVVWRGQFVGDSRQPPTLRFGAGLASDRSGLATPLLAQGYVPGQLLQLTFHRVGQTPFDARMLRGPERERVPVVILPNIWDAYRPSVPEAHADAFASHRQRPADLTLEVTATELVPIDDRRDLYVIHATPRQLTVWSADMSQALFEQQFDDVAALEQGQILAASPEVRTPALTRLPLTAETADLLVARYRPEALDDVTLARMLLARWAYEASYDRRNDAPDWGRFFVEGAPKPGAAELETLAQRFRDWTLERAQSMPTTVTLDMGTVHAGRPGPIHLGAGAPDMGMRQLASSCQRAAQAMRRQGEPVRARTLENACSFLDQALTIVPREVLLTRAGGDPRQVIRQLTQTADRNRPHPMGLPRHSGDLVVGPRVHCNLVSAGQDVYCRAGLKALDEELLGRAVRLNDVLVLDQEVVLPDSPEIARLSSPRLALDLEVTGIREADELAPHPFGVAYRDHRAFLGRVGLRQQDQRRDLDQALPLVHFLLDARILEARLLDGRSGETVAMLPLQQPRTLDQGLLAEAELEAPALPAEPFGPAVVGLQLGMTFAAAETIIREHMAVGRVLVAERSSQEGSAARDPAPYTSGRLYESADGTEVIIVYDEPPSAPGVVLGIVRQLALPKGTIAPGQIESQLEQRYGSPTVREQGSTVWLDGPDQPHHTSAACWPRANAEARITMWRSTDDDAEAWNPPTATGQPTHRMLPGMGRSATDDPRSCRTTLTATFSTDSHPDYDRLVLRLLDERLYAEHFAASRHMIERGQTTIGTSEPDQPAIEIRL